MVYTLRSIQISLFVKKILYFFYLAILNSKLMNWVYKQFFGALHMSGGYLQFQAPQLRAIPMFNTKRAVSTAKKNQIEDIKKLAQEAINADEFQLQIIINQIDSLVFNLYGLTQEERDIVLGDSDASR